MCRRLRPALILASFLCAFFDAGAQVTNITATPDPVCAGSTLTVGFDAGAADVGVDTVILKNASGALIYVGTVNVAAAGASSTGVTVPDTLSGNYTVNIKSISGVTVELADSVEVKPLPTVSASSTNVCSGVPANLSLTSNLGAGTLFIWTPGISTGVTGALPQLLPIGGLINDVLTTVDNVSPGTIQYLVTAISLSGCSTLSATPIIVSVNPTPVVTTVAPASPICSGTTLTIPLTASTSGANTFKWTSTTIGVTDPADQTTFVSGPISEVITATSNSVAGSISYAITPKSSAGCEGNATTFNVAVNPAPGVATTAPASPICSGTTLNIPLTATTAGASTFKWTSTTTNVTDPADQTAFVSGPIADLITNTTNNAAGSISYVITPKSSSGCEGAASTFNISVNPAPSVTSPASAGALCSGATFSLPLTASTSGSNTFTWVPTPTLVNGASTQSPAFVAGPISDVLTNTTNNTQGSVSYLVTAKSENGCVGQSQAIVVNVNPAPSVTTAPTSVCSGVPLTLALTASTAGANTFTWTPTQTGVTGAVSQGAFAAGPISNTLVAGSNTTAGSVSYLVTPRSAAGCTGSGQAVVVTVNPAPGMNAPVPTSPVCSRSALNVQLSATTTGASSFTWTPTQTGVTGATMQSTFVSGPITDVIRTLNNSTPGSVSYFVTPRSSLGCVGVGSALAAITVNPDPDGSVTPALPTTICSGTTINTSLVATTAGPNAFTWTTTQTNVTGVSQQTIFGSGPINNTLVDTSNSAVGTVQYVITPRSGAGCVGLADTFNITVNPSPVVTSAAPATALCSGSMLSLPLAASTPGANSFTWIPTPNGVNGATAQSPLFAAGPITATLTTTSNAAGTVSYLITPRSAAGCVGASTTQTVNVNPAPSVSVSSPPPAVICSGTSYTIPVAGTTNSGPNTFRWTVVSSPFLTGATASSGFVAGPISDVLTLTPGQSQGTVSYTIRARSAAGCIGQDSTTYTVVVNSLPRLTKLLDSVCSGTQYSQPFLSTASASGSYNWNVFGTTPNLTITGAGVGNNLNVIPNTFTYTNPAYGLADTVKYSVTTFAGPSGTGCSSTDTFRIKVQPRPVITNLNPAPICSGTQVSVLLKSSVVDSNNVSFTWDYFSNTVSNNGGLTLCPGCSAITQTLSATTPILDSARYQVTGNYRGCVSTAPTALFVRVNPRPKITSVPFTSPVCSGTTINIPLNTDVPSTYAWTTTNIAGFPQVTGNTSGNPIVNTLENQSNSTQAQVSYRVTPTSVVGQCVGSDSVFNITINPTPTFAQSNFTICSGDSAIINLAAATSTITGNTWDYTYIQSPTASGGVPSGGPTSVPSIRRRLLNSSDAARAFVVYGIQARSATCSSAVVNDTVFINPLPTLTSNRDTSICSDSVLVYNVKASTGANTRYAWLKVGAFGAPGNPSDLRLLSEPLSDALSTSGALSRDSVLYRFVLRSDQGCFADTNLASRPQLKVVINPTPDSVGVAIVPAKICEGAEMLNFSARRSPVFPERFSWGVSTGTAQDVAGENALISFPVPGTHTVFVTSNVPGFSCRSKPQPRTVSVDPGAVRKPNIVRFDNSLVCLTGTTGGNITNYQWGYDVKQNLDSVLLPGETFQSYVFTTLDTANKAYWVMATYAEGGCTYKAYFNRPATLGIDNISRGVTLPITVYPNPAHAQLNVELPRSHSGKVQLEVIDLAGRKSMQMVTASGSTTLDIADLTPGCYFINCYQDGQRVATARFIKN